MRSLRLFLYRYGCVLGALLGFVTVMLVLALAGCTRSGGHHPAPRPAVTAPLGTGQPSIPGFPPPHHRHRHHHPRVTPAGV